MNLSEFVKEVLTEIVTGVRSAQQAEGGAFIVPSGDGGHHYAKHDRFASQARIKSTIVDFDIALTVEDSSKAGASGGLKVWSIGANAAGERASKDTTVSRVQFAVPILLPESQEEWHKALRKPVE
ncbi:hypothetical protein [Paraburkholderia domus]|uniref:hypothetical protein n=1 Tax=Paraburkholderia domus TaxID=2793075 RepID=UPI001912A056|nr:hypothetical protein [Paraburkholderia domus]MBK5061776.1 hypothetical protein [Burkholderia sp. R-70199]CAE6900266.1 hypothetical protein R70199_03652 [Paraburkholderia domus]